MDRSSKLFLLSGLIASTLTYDATADDPLTDFMLGGIERKADDLMARARSEANAVAWGVADAAKSTIEAWKQANSALLSQAFSGLSDQQKQLFNNMNEALERLEHDQAVAVSDAEKLTAMWTGVVKDLPFVNHDPELMNYRPRVVVPIGEAAVPMSLLGPKLANADPKMRNGDKDVSVSKPTDNELVAKINRGDLAFDETKSSYAEYTLSFDRNVSSWWKPWTWNSNERLEREATIWLLPKQMATYSIVPMLPSQETSNGTYAVQVGGRGRDSPYPVTVTLAPIWADQGFVYDTMAIAQNKFFSNAGGDQASCTGAKVDTITPKSFVFMMQMGHRTVFGGKRDSWVNCNLSLPIVKKTDSKVNGDAIVGVLNWTDDKLEPLPDNALDYTLTLKMFNGRSYIVTKDSTEPFGVVAVEKTDKGLLFRPKPPSDF